MGGAPPSWRCVWLGPDFQSIDMGGEWGGGVDFFLLLAGNSAATGKGWTVQRPRAGGSAPGPVGGGSGPCAPPSFVQLRILRVHAIRWHIPWGGGGCKPAGRGTRGSSPAPPRGASLPHIVPRGWGEGAAQARPAPPHPPRRRRKPPGPPLGPPADLDPGGDPPPPHKGRRPGGGGLAYRDVGDALLALVRHGPPLAPSARPADPWGWLSLGPALSRPRSPWAR